MPFKLEAKTIIESASLDLDARQLQALADALPHLQSVCDAFNGAEPGDAPGRSVEVAALDPVVELLSSVASLVGQTGVVKPKRYVRKKRKNPTNGG